MTPQHPGEGREDATWTCEVGPADRARLPGDADFPMRQAVRGAFRELTGHDPEVLSSGWGRAATPEPREDGWDELRRAINDELAGAEAEVGEPFYAGAAAAYNYVLSRWPLAAARGEPGLDVERLAALEEFLAASDAVEEGVVDFTLHASAVERLRAARKALG